MTAEQNKAVVRRTYDEIDNQRKLEVADEIIAPDFKLFPDSQPPYGPEGYKRFMEWILNQFPDFYSTVEEIVAEGDTVAVWCN